MTAFGWIIGTSLALLYILLPWYIIKQDNKWKEEYKNNPPELCRIKNWHLIDKVRVRDYLIADLEQFKKSKKDGDIN